MELSRLAAKQKRYRDMQRFVEHEVSDDEIAERFHSLLSRYQGAIAECWRNQVVSEQDSDLLDSIERELQELHQNARLRTSSR